MHLVTKRFSDSTSLDAMMDRLETLFDDERLDVLASFSRPDARRVSIRETSPDQGASRSLPD